MTASIIYDQVFQNSSAAFASRIRGDDGALITQAATTSIACTVSDLTTGAAIVVITPAVTVSISVFDTLQTDASWTKDATGYNFRHVMPATAFPTAGHVYDVEYTGNPTSGPAFKWKYRVTSVPTYS